MGKGNEQWEFSLDPRVELSQAGSECSEQKGRLENLEEPGSEGRPSEVLGWRLSPRSGSQRPFQVGQALSITGRPVGLEEPCGSQPWLRREDDAENAD